VPDIPIVRTLIDEGRLFYDEVVSRLREQFGFAQSAHVSDSKLILGPNSHAYTAFYEIFEWSAGRGARVIWFTLESHVPHMSSIIACMGLPGELTKMPLFVMNLNLKPRLDSFSAVFGFRGSGTILDQLAGAVPTRLAYSNRILIAKELPEGFRGIRTIFTPSKEIISWSCADALVSLTAWLDACTQSRGQVEETASEDVTNLEYIQNYKSYMADLHGTDGRVFDAVFGQGWVSETFNKYVVARA
jgi:hypothetical protein